jgi:hypothetical protein
VSSVANAEFWKEYKASCMLQLSIKNFSLTWEISVAVPQRQPLIIRPRMPRDNLGKEGMVVGSITKVNSLSETLCFASVDFGMMKTEIQVVCHGSELCQQLRTIRLNSSVRVIGKLALKPPPKPAPGDMERQESLEKRTELSHNEVEVIAAEILCLNSVAPDVHISRDHSFPPQSRLQYSSNLVRKVHASFSFLHGSRAMLTLFPKAPNNTNRY